MTTKKILIILFAVSFALSFFQLVKTFHSRVLAFNDTQLTSLIQKHPLTGDLSSQKIVSGKIMTLEFKANYNNLGIIAIKFDRPEKFSDTIIFRLKEKNASFWYYEQTYQAHTFDVQEFFTFGFPTIPQSKDRQYVVELESLMGREDYSLAINRSSGFFLTKYSFSKKYLMGHKDQIIPFAGERIRQYLNYGSRPDLISFVTVFASIILIPLVLGKLIIIFWKTLLSMEKDRKFNRFSSCAIPIILFFSTIGIFGYVSVMWADIFHDGTMFKPAMDVASGLMLYRDTFHLYGPLTTLLQAGALIIFGKYLITIKFLTVFFYGFIVLLLYFLYGKILPKLLVAVTIILFFILPIGFQFFFPWSSVYALFFQLGAAYAMIRSLETKKDTFVLLAGIATSLTFWCRQTVGAFLFLAIIGTYIYFYLLKIDTLRRTRRHILLFVIGNIIISGMFLFWIISNHAFIDWWLQSMVYPYPLMKEYSQGYSIIYILTSFIPSSFGPVSVWTLIPLSAIFLFIKYSFQTASGKKSLRSRIILCLCVIGFASWMQYFPKGAFSHTYWGAIPMLGLYAFFIHQLIDEYLVQRPKFSKYIVKYIAVLIIIFLSLPDIAHWVAEGIKKSQQPYYVLNTPSVLKNVRFTKEEATLYTYVHNHIQEYFQKNPSGNVITNGPHSLFLTFDSRIRNYQPVYINEPLIRNSIYPQFDPVKEKYIKETKPFLISYDDFLPEGYCRIDSNVWKYSIDTMFLATPCQFLNAE